MALSPTSSKSGSPIGTASGDLSGSYPGPTVAKVNGVSVSGTPSSGQTIVASSASAAAWGQGGAIVVLDTKSGDGTSGTFTFSAIPATYNHLYLVLVGRGDQAAAVTNISLTYNGVGGTSYDANYLNFDGAANSENPSLGAANVPFAAAVAASTATAGLVGMLEVFVPFYSSTTFFKIARMETMWEQAQTNAGIVRRIQHATFRSTSAISSLSLVLASGNFITGSKAILYGYS